MQSGHILIREGGDADEDQCQFALPLGAFGGGAVDWRMRESSIYGCVVEARRRRRRLRLKCKVIVEHDL